MRFCHKHEIHLISDEVYAFSVYHTDASYPGFTSVLSIDNPAMADRGLIHVLYGLSKVGLLI